jgi:hypothetical protein
VRRVLAFPLAVIGDVLYEVALLIGMIECAVAGESL